MRKWIYIIFTLIFSLYVIASIYDFNRGIAVLSAVFFPIFILVFLYKIDVFEREKFQNIFIVFILSFVISFITCWLWVPLRDQLLGVSGEGFFYMLFAAGIPEEIIKIIPVIILLKRTKYINEPIDFLIYASAAALGFAFFENIDYIYDFRESTPNIVAVRSLLPTFMHITCSSIFAFGIFLFIHTKKIKYLAIYFLIASAVHAFYNSSFLGLIFIFIIILYYSKLIRSLLNISPFFDENKIKTLKKAELILASAFIVLHFVNFLFICYYSELYNSDISKEDWFVDFFYVITAFVFYKIITRNLELEKGKFSLFGKKRVSFLTSNQKIIIREYYNKFNN